MNDMKLLVDFGGSGVKIKRFARGVLRHTYPFKPTSLDEIYACVEEMAKDNNPKTDPHVEGIAVSICGEYDIVNDGDAHALVLKAIYAQRGLNLTSAVNLSLGTSVGFGVLDWKGDVLHTCRGHNWEVNGWVCDTNAERKELYWALGSKGLGRLEETHGAPNAYIYYGQRLCHFMVRDLIQVFHPKTIGLSGGIVVAHSKEIEEGIRRECEIRGFRANGAPLDGIDIHLSFGRDSVMRGLSCLV